MTPRIGKFLFGTLITLMAAPASVFAIEQFTASLTGDQEVPPSGSGASGSAQLTLNDTEDALAITIQINGLDLDGAQTPDPNDDVTGLHIHAAPAGLNGGVVFGFISPVNDLDDLAIDPVAGTITSIWDGAEGNGTTLAAQLNNLRTAGLYFNVHTTAVASGEIRGQIQQVVASTPSTTGIPTLGWAGLVALFASLSLVAAIYLRRHVS